MEVAAKPVLKERLSNIFFKEKLYFLNRREINWKSIKKCALLAVVFGVIVLLFLPNTPPDQGSFHERADAGSTANASPPTGNSATQDAINQMQGAGGGRTVPRSLDGLYIGGVGGGGSAGGTEDRTGTMILARGGLDGKTQIPPGSRLSVRLYEKAIVANQGMPVIGVVTRDYVHDDAVAIPQGSKLFGEVSYDDGGDRAKVDWHSVQFPDGRERQLSAIGVGTDGQVGVSGNVHSNAVKNTVGQTLTRFIGAYAEGSMQRGALGGQQGGNDNGWKNAIADTAKDRAASMAEGLKKEKKWIEISNSTEFYAVFTTSFAFRDPGATYGR